MSNSGVKVLFTESRYRDLVDDNRPESVEQVFMLDEEVPTQEAGRSIQRPFRRRRPRRPGITALPVNYIPSRGVKLTNGAIMIYVMGTNSVQAKISAEWLATPLYHIADVTSMLNALYSGRVVVLLHRFEHQPGWA